MRYEITKYRNTDKTDGRLMGDGWEMDGRWMGDGWEMDGRWIGDG